jgi:hypothetical protein
MGLMLFQLAFVFSNNMNSVILISTQNHHFCRAIAHFNSYFFHFHKRRCVFLSI